MSKQKAADAKYERRIESIRRRLLAAWANPIRHSSNDIRRHIGDLVRSAEATRMNREIRK